MDSEASILRSARSFFGGTAASRVMGLLRDLSMAFCFGSAPEVAAFMVAYRLSNLFRRLLGEGNLQGGFVPQFERLRLDDEKKAALFYRDLSSSVALVLLVFSLLGATLCWALSDAMQSDIPLMTVAMMPGVVFLCLYAINSSVLQCQRRYFLPAVAPTAFNAFWIASVFFLSHSLVREAMFGLCFCILGAFGLQWLLTAWPVARWAHRWLSWREWLRPKLFSWEVRALMRPIAFGVVGVGAAQINSALDAVFARIADPAGPAFLWYAIRVQQLPLALFGIALSGALLPPLARAFQSTSLLRYRQLLEASLRKSAYLMAPCAFAMATLAYPGLDLLYGRGSFSSTDVSRAALCLQAYALGLVPMVFVLLLANGLYAQKEYALPMRCSLLSVGCNSALNAFFVFGCGWGEASIALATSLSSALNCLLLFFVCRKRVGQMLLGQGMARLLVASSASALISWLIGRSWTPEREFFSQVGRLVAMGGAFVAAFAGLGYALRMKEFFEIWKKTPQESGVS